MLIYFSTRILCSCVAFLYPGYASYKVLSQRPASEADLERWLMYWSVLGCIVGVEYVAEWLISWIPLYNIIKTLFLLYLALPQTHGSTFVYTMYLQPFLQMHELQIDATLTSLKAKLLAFIQQRLRMLWDNVSSTVLQQQPQPSMDPITSAPANAPPPTVHDPVSGPASLVSGLWRSYGPSIVASGAALLRQTAAAATSSAAQAQAASNALNAASPRPQHVRAGTSQSIRERRLQLEAELAALPPSTPPPSMPIPMPQLSPNTVPAYSSSRASSASDLNDQRLRARTTSVTKFEEVEVPSDAEGYDVRDDEHSSGAEGRPSGSRRASSWFGWGGAPKAAGYERVKDE